MEILRKAPAEGIGVPGFKLPKKKEKSAGIDLFTKTGGGDENSLDVFPGDAAPTLILPKKR